MENLHIRCIADTGCTLGEGPVWDDRNKLLYWVDILDNKIFRYDPFSESFDQWSTPEHIGFLILKEDGGLIAGFKTGLHHIELADDRTVAVSRIDRIAEDSEPIRFNDGICDNQGRIWGCTMDMNQEEPLGKYYCYDKEFNKTVVDEGFVVANGPALSPDGQRLYMVETAGGSTIQSGIYVSRLKGKESFSKKELLIEWEGWSNAPDGIITDRNGNLWVGGFGGNILRCFTSDGHLKQELELPAWSITKAAFGGENREILYVTTARHGTEEDILKEYPQTGGVFEIKGLEIKGQPTPPF